MHWAARVAGGAACLPERGFLKSVSCNICGVQGAERQRATTQHCNAGVRLPVACPMVRCVPSTPVFVKAVKAGIYKDSSLYGALYAGSGDTGRHPGAVLHRQQCHSALARF